MENKRIKLKTFTLKSDDMWLAQVIISSDGMFSCVSDYGNFSYAWRYTSEVDFRDFLLRLNIDYFCNKMETSLAYIVSNNNKVKKVCERFSEKILPQLHIELKKDKELNPNWE